MDFINLLGQRALNGTDVRSSVRYLGLKRLEQWEEPVETQDPGSMAKIVLTWVCVRKEKNRSVQTRLSYETKNKTYYTRVKQTVHSATTEYVHEVQCRTLEY